MKQQKIDLAIFDHFRWKAELEEKKSHSFEKESIVEWYTTEAAHFSQNK